MDSYEFNKIAGAVLGTVFVLFGGSILAESIFHAEAPEAPGFEIIVAEAEEGGGEGAGAVEEESQPIAALLQTADAEAGAGAARACAACHTFEEGGGDRVGPHLWDVVNRPIASAEGFSYSAALQEFSRGGEVVWDYEHLNGFLHDPQDYVPGTAMAFAGIGDDQNRANLIAYLRTLSNDPAPLPEPPAEEEQTAAAEGGEGAAAEAEAAPAAEGDAAPAPEGETAAAAPERGSAQGAAEGGGAQTASLEGDPAAGKAVFRACSACHQLGEGASNGIGPVLNGIMAKAPAAVEGYSYSNPFQEWAAQHEQWTPELMADWLRDPMDTVPGTRMAFPGIQDDTDLANVIAYLATFDESGAQTTGE